MRNRLSPMVTFPYQKIKGSVQQREQAAIHLVDKFYRNFSQKFDSKGKVPFEEVQKSVDEVFEKKLHVKSKPLIASDFEGLSDILYSPYSGNIIATTIEVSPKKGKLDLSDIPTVLHEFQHLADQIYNPKILSRDQHMTNKGLYINKYSDLYENYMYVREEFTNEKDKRNIIKQLENKIRKFLRCKSANEKLDYIQDARYSLMMEDQAYKTQRKYAKQFKKKNKPVKDYDLDNENKMHMFEEKIALLNKLGFEIIKKERAKHAKKVAEKNKIKNLIKNLSLRLEKKSSLS